MGGAPYKPVKEGGGCSFKCFRMKEQPCTYTVYAYSDSLPTKYQTSNNVKRSCGPRKLMFCNTDMHGA